MVEEAIGKQITLIGVHSPVQLMCLNCHVYIPNAPCEKSWKQGNPLSNTIKDTSTIMHKYIIEAKSYV